MITVIHRSDRFEMYHSIFNCCVMLVIVVVIVVIDRLYLSGLFIVMIHARGLHVDHSRLFTKWCDKYHCNIPPYSGIND